MASDLERYQTLDGVLPAEALQQAIEEGWITGGDYTVPPENVQPASIDLRLGSMAYRLRSSFLPGRRRVKDVLADNQMGPPIDLRDGAILEKDRPYLIPLIEQVRLPPWVRAHANPKSSTGRIDVFTRIICDGSSGFDQIPQGHSGFLFLEVISRSFTIHVREKLSLNQLRLIVGNPKPGNDILQGVHMETPLLYLYETEGRNACACRWEELAATEGIFLRVDLVGDNQKIVGYKAKKNSMLLDLTKVGSHRIEDFWDTVSSDEKNKLILEPEEFYILNSSEGVAIPPGFAGEMTAYDPTNGELRTHYAGFFDPGFGFSPEEGITGSRAVLEVRAHDVPFALEHRQRIARLEIERMAERPRKLYGVSIGSSYQNQRLQLSKYFTPPTRRFEGQLPLLDVAAVRPARGTSRSSSSLDFLP
ncbi:MAG: 2'-deoxycytidine 5'-triphosphate deaminase [Chloroflexi bacterium]|nr:2'-deoxycytidine 5'-triphosphate deaminase [Chloroflexota bacterium]